MKTSRPLLVVGAGIAGITAALEAAEAGAEVILIEREPTIGGRVLRSHQYFPKMCPPGCGMEINIRRIEANPRLRVVTAARVTAAEAAGDGWKVTLTIAPALVNSRCTACGDCEAACTTRVPDPFNLGMSTVKAIRLPHLHAWPRRYVFDRGACLDDEARAIAASCPYGAIDLAARETTETLEVGAVVLATGWDPYPIDRLPELGGGLPDVIANVAMERLASPAGPTRGRILRPSDGRPPARVAFVQCAGSRDVHHLPYCSGVCCLASLKQARYVKDQLPQTQVTIYSIDLRAPGRNEDLLRKVAARDGVRLVKGKVGRVQPAADGSLRLRVEDVAAERIAEAEADLVVLATGMVPSADRGDLALLTSTDDDGFALDDPARRVLVAGVARRPEDVASSVRDATGAAARAIAAAARRR